MARCELCLFTNSQNQDRQLSQCHLLRCIWQQKYFEIWTALNVYTSAKFLQDVIWVLRRALLVLSISVAGQELVNDIPYLRVHCGCTPDHCPSLWQIRVSEPSNWKPLSQVKKALLPNVTWLMRISPLRGASRRQQERAAESKRNTSHESGLVTKLPLWCSSLQYSKNVCRAQYSTSITTVNRRDRPWNYILLLTNRTSEIYDVFK